MIFVDSHVHIHDCFDMDFLLDSSLENFQKIADQKATSNNTVSFILLLTERNSEKWFDTIFKTFNVSETKKSSISKNWLASYNSTESFKVEKIGADHTKIYIVKGIQAVTVENIEVLGLYTNVEISDGLTLVDTVSEIRRAGGIAVLPWGVGKWIGKRGNIILEYLIEKSDDTVYLGDNGGRPKIWPTPKIFIEAEKKGTAILPGTDPLPLKEEADRIGSFGFYLKNSLSHGDDPTKFLKQELLSNSKSIVSFGDLQNNFRFLLNQIRLRLA